MAMTAATITPVSIKIANTENHGTKFEANLLVVTELASRR